MRRSLSALLLLASTALGLVSGAPASAQDVKVCVGDKPSGCISVHPKHPQYRHTIQLWYDLSEGQLPLMAYPDGNPWKKKHNPPSGSGLIIQQGDIR